MVIWCWDNPNIHLPASLRITAALRRKCPSRGEAQLVATRPTKRHRMPGRQAPVARAQALGNTPRSPMILPDMIVLTAKHLVKLAC